MDLHDIGTWIFCCLEFPYFSETYGLPNVLIEIRQDLLIKNHSINFWSNLITKILKGLSENPTDNSKLENEVKNEVISLTSSFPIYKNL